MADYEVEYENGSVYVEKCTPPKDAPAEDQYHIVIKGGSPNPHVDIYVHEGEAMDIATGLLLAMRKNRVN